MGIFDIFSDQPAKDAAAAQTAGLNAGYNAASGSINQGIDALKTNYTAALQPYMTNYSAANAGQAALGSVLGLNGAAGSDAALAQLRSTPGYKFQQQTLDDTVNAQAAASGMNASGNQLLALNKVNQGLADSTYNNYVSQLQPYLGASANAAGGIAGVNTGLGNATAGQYNNLAQMGWNKETGIGNANANADLAKYNASGNIWNAIGSIGGMGTSGGGTVGGNAVSGIGSALMSGLAMFSDERLKDDIEKVGELYDGQPVYKYRYIDSPVFQIGLMAQDVEKTAPDNVIEIGGYKAVNYDKATKFAADLSRFFEAA
ncbi:MAG: tail fiber domain-containing protein [bacterium]|nr:tail fiber domain-containing protein [bacterium]